MYQVDISARLLRSWLTEGNKLPMGKIVAGLPPNVRMLGGLFIPSSDDDGESGHLSLYFDDPENPTAELKPIEVLIDANA